jgi:leucyl aminopeptidase
MEIRIERGDILSQSADLLVVASYEGEDYGTAFMKRLDDLLLGKVSKLALMNEFQGKSGQSMLLPAPDGLNVEYILIVGLGVMGSTTIETAREASGLAVQTAKKLNLKTVVMEFFGEDHLDFDARLFGQAIAEALYLANYTFSDYKKINAKKHLNSVVIIAEDGRDVRKAESGVEKARLINEGVTLARDLVNTPAMQMTPTRLADLAIRIAKQSDGYVKCQILERKDCEKLGMGAYLGVALGSDEAPKFIHLTYRGEKAKKKLAIVGKGITFDSGGLSLKPADSMMTMKCDMAGAATVLGVFSTLSALRPELEIHGLIAATENMPSHKAIRPGDILTALNGKTIEVLNTDAEGRLTLADALVYAAKLEPDYLIDLATLTLACAVGLGEEIAGLMSNHAVLANKILTAAATSGEKIWEMPLEPRYRQLNESDIADLRNIPTSRYGGSLTAGLFLQEFVDPKQPWAHLDIAGPAFAERPMASYIEKGGTGFGVRTLIRLMDNL